MTPRLRTAVPHVLAYVEGQQKHQTPLFSLSCPPRRGGWRPRLWGAGARKGQKVLLGSWLTQGSREGGLCTLQGAEDLL